MNDSQRDKLRKLSKEDLIEIIDIFDKHNLGYPYLDHALSQLKHKKELRRIEEADKVSQQSYDKRSQALEILKAFDGLPFTAIPTDVIKQASTLFEKAELLDSEWDRLMGIKKG